MDKLQGCSPKAPAAKVKNGIFYALLPGITISLTLGASYAAFLELVDAAVAGGVMLQIWCSQACPLLNRGLHRIPDCVFVALMNLWGQRSAASTQGTFPCMIGSCFGVK